MTILFQSLIIFLCALMLVWCGLLVFQNMALNASLSLTTFLLLSLIVIVSVVKAFPAFRNLNFHSKWFLSLFIFGWICLFLVLYPGIYCGDFFYLLKTVDAGLTSDWFAHLYSLICMSLKYPFPYYGGVTFFAIYLLICSLFRLIKLRPINN